MRRLVFIGGIHGVGKTHFCNHISQNYNIPHYSASELIRKKKKDNSSTIKYVKQVESNQNYLVMALSELEVDLHIMLDGHFCLLTSEGQISRIPEIIFREISPSALLVLKDSVSEIHKRLMDRDGRHYDMQLLNDLQVQEIEYSRGLCKALGVPLLELEFPFDIPQAYQFISKYIESNGGV
ncbi:adenylate kinase [Paenibacillus cellulosilyticus]|uniref:Adenylate kinase n=1 Tax=Paenibacillus cellulosilyticus TaxID=375489 RepID=A0A2V2YNI6_9BACL|nr:ATP-binding protein [Paenibacillus cellulosilyticus]PWV97380.1 adenylate kinase [Paenibacillus cellulosilyticus]QKS48576.1 AAA family ATPase [Paenibacillus cellulosilyticus]